MEMRPQKIIEKAKEKKLDGIGVCDHNSAENVKVVKNIGQREGIVVIGGIEVTSQEEIHILGLFDEPAPLVEFQNIIYENLSGINDEEKFGPQAIVNENDEVVSYNNKLLIGATKLSVEKIVELIHHLDGLAIASHVDREAFSIVSQLGFIPEGLALDALEVSSRVKVQNLKSKGYNSPLVSFSDAHFLEEIGRSFTYFLLKEVNTQEIKKALGNKEGRAFSVI
jgi:hypothetical protein